MGEQIKLPHSVMNEVAVYSLRTATSSDLEFLFDVSTRAMEPVDRALNPSKELNRSDELAKYKEKFIPEAIQIISFQNEDVGRLRIVRSADSLYVGGIQILPEFQGKGIGTALFRDLIHESEAIGLPITLEVHDVNENALRFYARLGFVEVGHEGIKTLLEYRPSAK